jgi:hypothetical protein
MASPSMPGREPSPPGDVYADDLTVALAVERTSALTRWLR